jgi:hypothetical protein
LFALLASVAFAQECGAPTRLLELDSALGEAELAISALEAESLATAVAHAREVLPCLGEGIGSAAAARWFRVTGIERFISGDAGAAADRFRAARSLEPGYPLDSALGKPLLEAWAAASPSEGSWTAPLPPPAAGWLQVDGRRTSMAPSDRPYLAQGFDRSGAIAWTEEVSAGALPQHALVTAGAEPPSRPEREREPGGGHGSLVLLGAGLLTAGLGAGAMAWSADLQGQYLDSPADDAALDDLVRKNRVTGWTGIGLTVGAAGLVTGAVVVGRW